MHISAHVLGSGGAHIPSSSRWLSAAPSLPPPVVSERVVEVPVDRVVERLVDVPVTVERVVAVDRIVEVPVERVCIMEVPLGCCHAQRCSRLLCAVEDGMAKRMDQLALDACT